MYGHRNEAPTKGQTHDQDSSGTHMHVLQETGTERKLSIVCRRLEKVVIRIKISANIFVVGKSRESRPLRAASRSTKALPMAQP